MRAATRRAAGVLRRQRALGARTRCARSSRAFADPRGRLRLRPGGVRQRGRDQPGGRCTGATRCGCARSESRARVGHRRQRRDLRRAPRGLRRGRPGHGPRPLVPVPRWSSAAAARSTRPGARATEKMVPSIEGEWARKRRMMSHALADRRARRAARPARLPAAVRADDRLAPAAALRARRSCTCCVALATLRAARARRASYRARRRRPGALLAARRAAAACRRARCCVARYYVLTTASLAAGLYDWLRHGTAAGWDAAGGHAVNAVPRARAASARSTCWSRARLLVVGAPLLAVAAVRDPAGDARARDLPPAPRRPRRRAVRALQAAHDGHRRRDDGRRARRRRTATTGSRASGALLRRTSFDELPNLDQRAARRDVARRPAADGPGAGRPLHRRASGAGSTRCPG